MKAKPILTCLFTLTLFFTAALQADDWTRWRGPAGTGISSEKGWNPKALDNLDVRWQVEIGMGHATVAVQGNRLYTMGETTEIAKQDTQLFDVVYCLDAGTGKVIWNYKYQVEAERWPGPATTPVIDENRIYTTSRQGRLYCLSADKGDVIWHHDLLKEKLSEKPDWGFSASVLIYKNMAVVNAGLSGIAFNKKNGQVIWKSDNKKGGLGTPVLWKRNGRDELLINGSKVIRSVSPKDGKVLWETSFDSYTDPQPWGDSFFNSTNQDGLAMFSIDNGEVSKQWHQKKLTSYTWNNYIIIDGCAYGFARESRDWALHCIDLKTGESLWSEPMKWWGALSGAGNQLIVIDGEGKLMIVNANAKQFDPVSAADIWQLGNWRDYPNGRPNTCWTMPVLANGRLYVRTTYGQLTCVNME